MEVDSSRKKITLSKCIFCNNNASDNENQEGRTNIHKLLQHTDNDNDNRESTGEDWKSPLSTFFMFRKLLGLSPEFLTDLLKICGNPLQWDIELCRLCMCRFQEAEKLWNRLYQLLRTYENVAFEIKDTLLKSICSEEVAGYDASANEAAKTALVKKKVETCQVSEAVRAQFFIDAAKHDDTATRDKRISLLSCMGGKIFEDCSWNNKDMPYCLMLNDFENERKTFVETVMASQKSVPQEISNVNVTNEDRNNGSLSLEEQSDSWCKNSTGTNYSTSLQDIIMTEEEKPLRIVETNPLMEPEDDDNENNDAIPIVEAILKHDFDDDEDKILLINEDNNYNNPLTPTTHSVDEDNPKCVPGSKLTSKRPKTASKYKKKKRKINFLSIKVNKKAPSVFECSKCLGTFGARVGCQIHILRDHYGERHTFFHCHICEEKFTLNTALRNHVNSSHGSTKTAYDNDFNPELFESAFSSEKNQQRSNTEVGVKNASKSNSQINKLIFECPVEKCSDNFTHKRDLQLHTRRVHGKVPSRLVKKKRHFDPPMKLECVICAKRNIQFEAINIDILEVHYKKVHNEYVDVRSQMKAKLLKQTQSVKIKSAPRQKPSSMKYSESRKTLPDRATIEEHAKNPEYKCPECSRHFMCKVDMDQHFKLHHSSHELNCPYCSKSFTSQVTYEKHIESHKSFDVHECQVCHLRIIGLTSFEHHMRTTHPELSEQQEQQQQSSLNPEYPDIFGL